MLKPPFEAKDISELFKNVTRGAYPAISSSYSKELANVIKSLLQQKPKDRPSCDKILSMPEVQRNMPSGMRKNLITNDTDKLLGTIRLPYGNLNMNKIKESLPKANYSSKPNSSRGTSSPISNSQRMPRNSSLPSFG